MTATDDERLSPRQVKDLVYDKLRQALIDQVFAPGEPLREAALTVMYGVSKTPIREALVRLEQDGLVEIAAYRGARASSYTQADVDDIFEARTILESECVRRAAEQDDDTSRRLRATVDTAEKAVADGDLTVAAACLDDFDEVLFEHLRNALLDEVRERLSMHLQRMGRVNITAASVARSLGEHRRIIAAIESGDADRAVEELRAHLRSVHEQQLAAFGL